MPAPDPTAPEVKELLHSGYSLEELKAELVRQTHRRDDASATWTEDERAILNTWITAVKGELVRREAGG